MGDAQITPGWSAYQKTVLYNTYDVTGQLQSGANAVGVMLGNGMYNCLKIPNRYTKNNASFGVPKLIMQLDIEHPDGTHTLVVSDGSWKTARGPMVVDQVYGGEDYDARREFPGWDKTRFEEEGWQAVAVTLAPGESEPKPQGQAGAGFPRGAAPGAGPGTARLTAEMNPPTKIQGVYEPVSVTPGAQGGWLYDFGQNLSGWPHIRVKGKAGATVKMTPGETASRGAVSQRASGGPMWFSYTLKGEGEEEWRPKFMYYGYRYVLVEGANPAGKGGEGVDTSLPEIKGISSEWIYADARRVGAFTCSDDMLNKIHALILGAAQSNMQSVLSDCPHREKLGWLEQSHLVYDAISANFDVETLYRKILRDAADSQTENGMVPGHAPEYAVFGNGAPNDFRDSPEWGSAAVINPWYVYQSYGDVHTLQVQYDSMKKYVDYLTSRSTDHIVSHGLGDCYDIGSKAPGVAQLTTKALTATAVYYQDLEILRQTAELLGRREDARTFADLGKEVKAAFNAKFYNSATGDYEKGSQTANAMPLVVGLVEDAKRPAVLKKLVQSIADNQYRVTAGDVGFSYVVRALTDSGEGETLYRMMTQTAGPGYVMQVKAGKTTLTEAWSGGASQNHIMLGHAEAWLHRGLAGIQNAPGSIAYKEIVIRPQVVDLAPEAEGKPRWVKDAFDSPRGRIVSNWSLDGKK